MVRSTRKRGVRFVVAWGLLLLLAVQATGAAAHEGCEVMGKDGELRDCTFTEELASCVLDSYDSLEQCIDASDGLWDRVACEVTHIVDDGACLIAAPITWGFGRLF